MTQPLRHGGLTAATVVCTSCFERAGMLRSCVDSLLAGRRRPDELFVVVDADAALRTHLWKLLPREVTLLRSELPGLSAARNAGIAAAGSDIVTFVDDDATVEPGWLSSLLEAFSADPELIGAGGPVLPVWEADRRWMPEELLWIVGCTYRGHREDAGPIRNPIGCNMAFRRRELLAAGCFAPGFGKRGRALETCEDTEIGLRLEQVHGAGRIRYLPDARVRHFVPATRVSWRLVVRRSLSEGLAKGRLRVLYSDPAVAPERRYARLLLGQAAPRLMLDTVRRRDRRAALGLIAVLGSLAITAAAFAAGFTRERGRQTRLARTPAHDRTTSAHDRTTADATS